MNVEIGLVSQSLEIVERVTYCQISALHFLSLLASSFHLLQVMVFLTVILPGLPIVYVFVFLFVIFCVNDVWNRLADDVVNADSLTFFKETF